MKEIKEKKREGKEASSLKDSMHSVLPFIGNIFKGKMHVKPRKLLEGYTRPGAIWGAGRSNIGKSYFFTFHFKTFHLFLKS